MKAHIQHPAPNVAIITVEGVDYSINRIEVLPGKYMLEAESIFWRTFGPATPLIQQLWDSFREADQARSAA